MFHKECQIPMSFFRIVFTFYKKMLKMHILMNSIVSIHPTIWRMGKFMRSKAVSNSDFSLYDRHTKAKRIQSVLLFAYIWSRMIWIHNFF